MKTSTNKILAEVIGFHESEPKHFEHVCVRHELGGWMAGYWNADKECVEFYLNLGLNPWYVDSLTHWLSLDALPSFDD